MSEFFTGLPVFKSEWIADGEMYATGDGVFIGVKPESDVAHEARQIVRHGLATELSWLRQPVLTGRGVLALLRPDSPPIR